MSFTDMGKKADELTAKAKNEGGKVATEVSGMSSTLKYILAGVLILAVLAIGSCMLKGGNKPAPMNGNANPDVAYSQPVQQAPVAPQVVYVNNPDPMAGVLTGMAIGTIMSNGVRYDGHNGYGDSHYNGPSKTIVKNVTVNNYVTKAAATPVAASSTASVAAPVAQAQKVKAPGDDVAKAEAAKMAAEQKAKDEQKAKQEALKTQLKAKQEAKKATSAPAVNLDKPAKSNFNSFSRSASKRK